MTHEHGEGRLPDCFLRATLRGTTPVVPSTGYGGLSFNLGDGQVIRIALGAACRAALVRTLLQFDPALLPASTVQSAGSELIPSADGSPVAVGQNVCPPTKSSMAQTIDLYEPSDSSPNTAWKRP